MRFSYKKATLVANLFFILLSVAFLIMAANFEQAVIRLAVDPSYYPILVCVGIIITATVSIVSTLRNPNDRVVEIPNPKKGLIIIGLFALFVLLWQFIGQFYVVSFVVMGAVLYTMSPQPNSLKKIIKTCVISLCMQIFVYFIFERLMFFRF